MVYPSNNLKRQAYVVSLKHIQDILYEYLEVEPLYEEYLSLEKLIGYFFSSENQSNKYSFIASTVFQYAKALEKYEGMPYKLPPWISIEEYIIEALEGIREPLESFLEAVTDERFNDMVLLKIDSIDKVFIGILDEDFYPGTLEDEKEPGVIYH